MAIFPAAISSAGSSGGGAFYNDVIGGSVRLSYSDSSNLYFSRSSNSNRKTWTFSGWIKPAEWATRTSDQSIFNATPNSFLSPLYFTGIYSWNNRLSVSHIVNGSTVWSIYTDRLFRDPTAWYHIVVEHDTTQATASDRVKLYVNGVQITTSNGLNSSTSYPSQDYNSGYVGTSERHWIGGTNNLKSVDAYLAELHYVDGTALDPTSFGESKGGTWVPIEYTGSHGTNGFYLDFGTSLTADQSGNGYTATANSLASTDLMLDTPENNFCTWNSVSNAQGATLREGNLRADGSATDKRVHGTHAMKTGKWYWEINLVTVGNRNGVGIFSDDDSVSTSHPDNYGYIQVGNSNNYTSGTSSYSNLSWSGGDVITFAFDADNGKIFYGKNAAPTVSGSGDHYGLNTDATYLIGYRETGATVATNILNCGQDSSFEGRKTAQGNTDDNGYGDFYYSPPSGYLALCTANIQNDMPESIDPAQDASPQDHFNTVIWTATNAYHEIRGVGFKPDWVWGKKRTSAAESNVLVDVVRGSTIQLITDSTAGEYTNSAGVSAFVDDGFNLVGTGSGSGVWNGNAGSTHVAWCWKGANGTATNTDGNVTTTVSANPDAGFAIVDYNGGGNGSTMGHGLGAVPACIIVKKRDSDSPGGARGWSIYHKSLATDKVLYLNTNGDTASEANFFREDLMSTSVFGVNGDYNTGYSGDDYIAYVFAEVDGFSRFGLYRSNGSSNGPFVYTGFRPAFLLIKRIGYSGDDWHLYDSVRDTYNPVEQSLYPNKDYVEGSTYDIDFTANGFKIKSSGGGVNGTAISDYVYMAFAETPFKYANAR